MMMILIVAALTALIAYLLERRWYIWFVLGIFSGIGSMISLSIIRKPGRLPEKKEALLTALITGGLNLFVFLLFLF